MVITCQSLEVSSEMYVKDLYRLKKDNDPCHSDKDFRLMSVRLDLD